MVKKSGKNWRSYDEARRFVKRLKLEKRHYWTLYLMGEYPEKQSLPTNIPKKPDLSYKEIGWVSWQDFLSSSFIPFNERNHLSHGKAREFVLSLNLKNQKSWQSYCIGELKELPEKPIDVPRSPSKFYLDKGWQSWGHFLGTGVVSSKFNKWATFISARKFVRVLKLKSYSEWNKYCKGELKGFSSKPMNIPVSPRELYKDKGWKSLGDFLGNKTVATKEREYLSYKKAKEFVHKLNIKNYEEWYKYASGLQPSYGLKPSNIPSNPWRTYKDKGWKGYKEWLGN